LAAVWLGFDAEDGLRKVELTFGDVGFRRIDF
jgi:hypothetical protein